MANSVAEFLSDMLHNLCAPVAQPEPIDDPSGEGRQLFVYRHGYNVKRIGPRVARREHNFHDLRSFAEWLLRHGDAAKAEILVGEQKAEAVLGKDADDDQVTCVLKLHPTFEVWRLALGKPMPPKVFHQFVRSVVDTFATDAKGGPHYGDMLLANLAQLKVVTGEDIDLNIDPRGFYSLHGGKQKTQVDAKIEPAFDIRTPIFVGIPGATADEPERLYKLGIVCQIDVEGEGAKKGVSFTLSCPGLDRVRHDARMDAVAFLRTLLGDGWLVGLGDMSIDVVAVD